MTCYHPIQGYKSKTTSSTGKRSIVFDSKNGYPELPMSVACGRCIGCRLERSRQWSVRLMHEAQMHQLKCFITLTYDDEHLPYGHVLVKRDFQLFMKSLRKRAIKDEQDRYPGQKIQHPRVRFFHCGEYGETNPITKRQDGGLYRPHYHAILFGIDFADKKPHSKNERGDQLYTSEKLQQIWGKGFCYIGAVTHESTAYVARYILKKITGKNADTHYQYVIPETGEIIKRTPEYISMSLKPGIGNTWYEKYKSDVFPSDTVVSKGKPRLPPNYYLNKLRKEEPDKYESIKSKRIKRAAKYARDNTPQRLADKETCRKAKIKQLQRNI